MTQEIEVKFQELVSVSPQPPAIDITGLHAVANKAKALVDVDINDADQMKEVTLVRKELAEARKQTVDFTEAAREQSYKIYKSVLEIKNTLLEIITPEEDRLKEFEKALKEQEIRESRLEALPAKRERITTAGLEFTDDEILGMADADFEIEYNSRLGAKLEADRIAQQELLAKQQAELDAQRLELTRKADEADRTERAREEERRLAEERVANQKVEAERLAVKVKAEADAEIARLKAESEAKEVARLQAIEDEKAKAKAEADAEIAAEAKRQATAKFQSFLNKNEWNDDTDIIIDGVNLYRFVAKFK